MKIDILDDPMEDANYALVRAWVELKPNINTAYDCFMDLEGLDEYMLVDEIIATLRGTNVKTKHTHMHKWKAEYIHQTTKLEIQLL